MSKLTKSQVRQIKDRLWQGQSGPDIAQDYQISRQTVHLIKTGESYPNIGRTLHGFKPGTNIPQWKVMVAAVMLYYDLPRKQIAETVNLSERTVYKLQHYIKDKGITIGKALPVKEQKKENT